MREIFVDAFHYVALINPKDSFSSLALRTIQDLQKANDVRFVTTVWILLELGDAFCRTHHRSACHRLINEVMVDPDTIVISKIDPWFHRGLRLYGNRLDKTWSLTDCISFEIMSARGITEALTGDHHFIQAGFLPLLAAQSLG